MFGRGAYFAPNASKCDLYTDEDVDGHRCIFLARVVLGATLPRQEACPDLQRLPAGFDSVIAVP
eukprot:5650713-Amphidinium_carterae.1